MEQDWLSNWVTEFQLILMVMVCIVLVIPILAISLLQITNDKKLMDQYTNGWFTTDRQDGIEIGIRAKIPFVGFVNSNGDGTYSYSLAETALDGLPRHWNFDWTINTDYDDSTGLNIADLTYELGLDGDPGLGTNFLTFDPIHSNDPIGGTNCADHAIGDNSTINGGGDFVPIADCRSGTPAVKAAATTDYAALIGANNVAQQSWRYSFFPAGPLAAYNPDIPGTYAVYTNGVNF